MLVECFRDSPASSAWLEIFIIQEKGKKNVQRIFFFSPLENIQGVWLQGEWRRQTENFWWQTLDFCVQIRGIFRSAGNMISHEHHTWFIPKFQRRFQSHFNFGSSSVGSAHCGLVWKASSQRGEIKPVPASLWSVTVGHLHGSPQGLQPLYLAPSIGQSLPGSPEQYSQLNICHGQISNMIKPSQVSSASVPGWSEKLAQVTGILGRKVKW